MPALPPTAAKVDSDAIPGELTGPDGALLAADMLRRMLRVRLFEEATISLFDGGELPAMVHLSIGQEAAAVGACLATTDRDTMTGNHRSHGHPIAKGAALGPLMAELLGKAGRGLRGQGRQHAPRRLLGRQPRRVRDRGLGDSRRDGRGAQRTRAPQGRRSASASSATAPPTRASFHESLNIASVWRLPVIFFCENNGYAVSVPQSESTAVADIARRAAGYDMPGVVVDGQDVARGLPQASRGSRERARRASARR